MKLVEVIAGGNTPADLVDYIKNLSVEIGKTPVVVNEAPGFVVNKILIPYCNEGVWGWRSVPGRCGTPFWREQRSGRAAPSLRLATTRETTPRPF